MQWLPSYVKQKKVATLKCTQVLKREKKTNVLTDEFKVVSCFQVPILSQIGPPFAVVITSMLMKKISTRFRVGL